jgi:SAM-dependent methyltransferase
MSRLTSWSRPGRVVVLQHEEVSMGRIDQKGTSAGAAVYTPLTLRVYDWWVLGMSNRFAWDCPTRDVLLPFFRQHMGHRHLDVGVGTGFYLAAATPPRDTRLVLMDLNLESLHRAQGRAGLTLTRLVHHDVMEPFPADVGQGLDSVSLFYLLHCLPGPMVRKTRVFANIKGHLAPGGVVYGATILGDDANHNALGRRLMRIYNSKGIFGNHADTVDGLEQALASHFWWFTIRVVGKVALFEAREPRLTTL